MPFSFLTPFPNTKTYSSPSHFPQDTIPVFFPPRCFNSLLPGTQVVLTRSPAPCRSVLGANDKPSARDRQQPGGWVWSAANGTAEEMGLGGTPAAAPSSGTWQARVHFLSARSKGEARAGSSCFSQEVASLPTPCDALQGLRFCNMVAFQRLLASF